MLATDLWWSQQTRLSYQIGSRGGLHLCASNVPVNCAPSHLPSKQHSNNQLGRDSFQETTWLLYYSQNAAINSEPKSQKHKVPCVGRTKTSLPSLRNLVPQLSWLHSEKQILVRFPAVKKANKPAALTLQVPPTYSECGLFEFLKDSKSYGNHTHISHVISLRYSKFALFFFLCVSLLFRIKPDVPVAKLFLFASVEMHTPPYIVVLCSTRQQGTQS